MKPTFDIALMKKQLNFLEVEYNLSMKVGEDYNSILEWKKVDSNLFGERNYDILKIERQSHLNQSESVENEDRFVSKLYLRFLLNYKINER